MILKDLMILIKNEPAQAAPTGSKIPEPVKSQKWYEKMLKTGCFGAKSNLKDIFFNRRLRNRGYQGKKKIASFHAPQTFISATYEQSDISLRKSKKDSSKIFFTFLGIRCLSPGFHTHANLPLAKLTYNHKQCLKTTMKCFGRLNTGLSPQNQNLTKGA